MWKKIKLVFSSVREYKVYAILTPLFMIGEAAIECALPFVMSEFVGTIEGIDNLVPLIPYFILLIAMTCVSIFCGIMGGRMAAYSATGFAKNLRSDLYKKIESFSFENIDHFHGSSLVTRMTTDINTAQNSFQMCTRILFRAPLMLIFSSIMAFVTGGNLAWIFIIAIPVIFGGIYLIASNAVKIFKKVFKRYDALNESVQENVAGIRVVKTFVREEFEQSKFNSASSSLTNDLIKAEKIVALNNPLMNTSIHAVYLLTLYFASTIIFAGADRIFNLDGSITIIWGSLTIPQMSALLTYGIQILASIQMVSMILFMLIMSLESVRRIAEVLEEESTIINPENPVYEIKDGSIDFNDVNFKYKATAERYALENINIHIKSGQFIGILGSTGSGKTSLINLISRLYDVTEGELLVGGVSVKDYDLKVLRDGVSVVLQKNFLFSGDLESNLKWGDPEATVEEMKKATSIAQIPVESVENLKRPVEQGGANFSGGQKQRICIARAILKKPKILILDDSTSAVDTKTDKLIRKGLKEELPEMTKIVIAQRISSIEDADQIIIMDDGKISAIGTHDELLKTSQIYQEVYYTQNRKGDN